MKAMAIKNWRARRGIYLSSKEEENYESDIDDETNLSKAGNDKNSLQLWERGAKERYK